MTRDTWDDGSAYEQYVGRWSRVVARRFVRWLAVPPGSAWLDVGCGTGALTWAVLADADPRVVIGCDRAARYVAVARRRTPDERARFVTAALAALPDVDGGFDAVVAGLVLNFLPAPADGVAAMRERAGRGATVAGYVWDYADGMQMMRVFWDVAVELDPEARTLDEGLRFPLCRPDALRQLLESAGLRDVQMQAITIPTTFRDFDDYWAPFLGGQGPAPGYVMDLPPARRAQLREAVRRRLPTAPDGTIPLSAKAWAVKGVTA